MRIVATTVLVLAITVVPVSSPGDYGYLALEEELTAHLAAVPGRWGVYVLDLQSGLEAGFGADQPFYMASTEKLGTVLALMEEAARGDVDLETSIPYRAAVHRLGGSGYLQTAARDGDTYSLATLARLSITLSDNIAHAMIIDHLSRARVAAGLEELGLPGRPGSMATPRELGRIAAAAVDLAGRHPEIGSVLLEDMTRGVWKHGIPDGIPGDVAVAHKPGWVGGVTSDVAIVMAERPYVLAVMSDGVPDRETGFSVIASVAEIVHRHLAGF